MNWLQRVTKKSQATSSSGILISLLRGEVDRRQALADLTQTNDPETCNNIAALINDPGIQAKFPDAYSALYTVGNELNCLGGQQMGQDVQNADTQFDQTQPMENTYE